MRKQHESLLQQSCVKWFDYAYPKLRMNLFAIPNEGARTIANGARMKAQGRRAGVADMFLAVCSYYAHDTKKAYGIFFEFKFGKGKQTDTQRSFQSAVEFQEYRYEVITDFDSFRNIINEYLK